MTPQGLRPMLPPPAVVELRPAEANRDLLITLFKWHRLILLFGLVVTVAAAIAMALQPPVWSAVAKILIKPDRDALSISGLPHSSVRTLPPEVLQSEAEFLRSRVVLAPVARALLGDDADNVSDSRIAQIASALRANLAVAPVPNTTVLQVTNYSDVKGEAEEILGMIVDSFVEQRAIAYSGSKSLSAFFERETEAAATGLREAEDRLRRWQEANNIVAVDSQIAAQLTTVGDLEGNRRRTEAEIEAARAHIDTLARSVAALPAQAVTSREYVGNPVIAQLKSELATQTTALANLRDPVSERLRMDIASAEVALRDATLSPLVVRLRGDLVTAELALHEIRQRYLDGDRRVQEKVQQVRRLQEEIAVAEREAVKTAQDRLDGLRRELRTAETAAEVAVRDRLAALTAQLKAAEREGDIVGRETVSPNPLRELLDRDLAGARPRLTALASQRDALGQQAQAARAELLRLRAQRVDYERMARAVEVARALYLQNTKRLDDARIAAGLEKQQLMSIVVLEPPYGTRSGGGLKRTVLVTLLAAIVGLGLGVAAAFALEFFSWSLRTREDVEFYLGVPVLAAIPAVAGPITRSPALVSAGDVLTLPGDTRG